jgi:hypothetical protein
MGADGHGVRGGEVYTQAAKGPELRLLLWEIELTSGKVSCESTRRKDAGRRTGDSAPGLQA